MIFSTAKFERSCQVDTGEYILNIGPGELVGTLLIVFFADEARNIGRDRGWFKLTFVFADAQQRLWRYIGVLDVKSILPPPGVLCSLSTGHFKAHVTLNTLADWRDEIRLPLADGRVLITRAKYNDMTYKLREEPDGLAVQLTVLGDYGRQVGRENEYISVAYHVPLAHLLWRKAPLPEGEDLFIESAPHVSCVPCGHMAERGQMRGFIPGPVHATPRQP